MAVDLKEKLESFNWCGNRPDAFEIVDYHAFITTTIESGTFIPQGADVIAVCRGRLIDQYQAKDWDFTLHYYPEDGVVITEECGTSRIALDAQHAAARKEFLEKVSTEDLIAEVLVRGGLNE